MLQYAQQNKFMNIKHIGDVLKHDSAEQGSCSHEAHNLKSLMNKIEKFI